MKTKIKFFWVIGGGLLQIPLIDEIKKLGYKVILPKLNWSGMPYISYGDIEKATEIAQKNINILI